MQIDRGAILQIAREVGMLLPSGPYFAEYESAALRFADRIAQRAAEAERQDCEKECEQAVEIVKRVFALSSSDRELHRGAVAGAEYCLDAIRARGTTKEQA